MKLFNFLRRSSPHKSSFPGGTYFNTNIDEIELKLLVNNAILVFDNNVGADHDQLVELIKTYHDDEDLAFALYRFIPIAYCRLFIPEPAYSDDYVIYKSESDKTTYHFSKDAIYNLVLAVCTERLKHAQSSDNVYSILYHSAEFKAINSALLNGSDLKDLVCSPAYFL